MNPKQENLLVVLDIGSAHTRVVAADLNEGVLRYRVLIERSAYVDSEVGALVDRLCGGDEAPLIALLSERRRADPD